MFVLPPPPRYPINQLAGTGAVTPLIETNNSLEKPTGPEHQLVVGEGTYVLRDQLHLATPPPHPSEAPVHNPNPLATTINPPTAGTRLSLLTFAPRKTPSIQRLQRIGTANSSGVPPSIQEHPSEGQSQDGDASKANGHVGLGLGRAPVFGEGNPALPPVNVSGKDASKKRKPKNNIVKSNSSFVSRVIPHETLTKRLLDRDPNGLIAFANINRALQWLDLSSPIKEEHMTKVLFTKAHALCHNVNQLTRSNNHIDLIMGFSTSDLIWYEPISQKYARLNKNGVINVSAVSDVQWLPNSENLFLAAHRDGSLVFYDKEKEDAPFIAEEPASVNNGSTTDAKWPVNLQIKKSVQSKNQKSNPVAYWKVSNSKINAFAFSPDSRRLAVVSEDGSLRVVEYLKEQILHVFTSYYGGIMSVCWSPDGRYIVTGGQDDLVSIWSLEDSMLVARCQGHNSWVTGVAFDPWRCDERNYRIGSVGEDCRLLLWDFSVGMLHRPRAASVINRGSIISHSTLQTKKADGATSRNRSNSNLTNGSVDENEVVHPVEPRSRTAILPPVMAKSVDDHPLAWLTFEEDCVMVSCRDGHIHTWDRPKETSAGEESPDIAARNSRS